MVSSGSLPTLQLISKPVVPPFSDGSKCLVRDLCQHLTRVQPHVLTDGKGISNMGSAVVSHAIYGAPGGFSPALQQNLRVVAFLLLSSRAKLWHFVFAPNPLSSRVGHALKTLKKVPIVQTVASPPRDFSSPQKLLFGDIVVAQSEWTRQEFLRAYKERRIPPPRIELIRPPAPELGVIDAEAVRAVRARFRVEEGSPLFLYPGDLEVSRGAERVIAMSRELSERVPGAKVVIAYRDKTSKAPERAKQLRAVADPNIVHFECNVPDIHALVKASTAVLFPVDDLYGKVDLPIVLLEAFRLGTPVVALDEGPLASLEGALLVGSDDADWLSAAGRLAGDRSFRASLCDEGRRAIETYYEPQKVAGAYEALYFDILNR